MKEFKVGERITLEVIESKGNSCEGCAFCGGGDCSAPLVCTNRSDGKNVIFKLVEPKK